MNKSKKPSYLRIKDNKMYARITWIDESGKRRDTERRVYSITEARQVYEDIRRTVREDGSKAVDGDRVTFAQLAESYEVAKLKPPKIHQGRKVAGLKSYKTSLGFLKLLKKYFGNRRIKQITFSELEAYKQERLDTPKKSGKPRAIASVHRELSTLRVMFNFARREGWLRISPFERGEGIITTGSEESRTRIMSKDEEIRLLSHCTGRREHLYLIILVAVDTGMRRGEIFTLKWSDIDFQVGAILIKSGNTKTEKARTVGITKRMKEGLLKLQKRTIGEDDELVFPYGNIKHSFGTACKLAEIEGLHFHDLRHTHTTLLIENGFEAKLAQKLTGHTQASTFDRYVNPAAAAARKAAELMDKRNAD